jgi:hypothetical protein
MSRDDVDYDDIEHEDYDLEHEDEDIEIPDVDWKEDIKKIEDDDIREKEIQEAKKILEQERQLRDRLDRGEIDLGRYESIHTDCIKPSIRRARMRAALGTVNLTGDDIGSLAEDKEFLLAGDTRLSELKDQINKKISALGPKTAQEKADRLLGEEIIGKDAHSRISRQVRIRRRRNK